MAQAHGDPEELKSFANSLQHYLDTIEEETNTLNGAFNQLGDTWNDEKKATFEEEFNNLLNALESFKENAAEQIPYLNTLAGHLEDYLRS